MNRPFLFLAGEYSISMPIVFSNNNWQHSMSALYIDYDDTLHRRNRIENIKGIILYADLNNKEKEEHNLKNIINSNIPCYPNPNLLLKYINRHYQHQDLIQIPGTDNNINNYSYPLYQELGENKNYPLVLKTGLMHRGLDKYLINCYDDYIKVEKYYGIATLGPYYKGSSVRVLFVEDTYFIIEIENDNWIKNSAGASIKEFPYNEKLIKHAKAIKEHLNLDIVGVDYIINEDKIYFLEANHFPGLNISDEAVDLAKKFFTNKMKEIEKYYNT